MARLAPDALPKYGKHKQSGQARVVLSGRHFLLGPYDSPASRAEYNRLVAEWLAAGRQLPARAAGVAFTVAVVAARFLEHARRYYVDAEGKPTSEQDSFRQALRPLVRLYGHTPAADFSPLCLKALRDAMTKPAVITDPKTGKTKTLKGWCRTLTNRQVSRVRMVFKWAAENELVPASVYYALTTVAGLRKHRTEARESEEVKPVEPADVEAALPHMAPQVRAMVQLQLLTSARGGELRRLRTCDLDTSGEVWVYRPDAHKTAHHGHTRVIWFGPQARAILEPMLKPDLQAFIFSPADAAAWWREQARLKRKSPLTPSQIARAERARLNAAKAKRRPRDRYTKDSYARAVARACRKAGVAPWHPHQLRHTAGTRIREEFGVEAASVILGHKNIRETELYAEKNVKAARRIMSEVG